MTTMHEDSTRLSRKTTFAVVSNCWTARPQGDRN